MAMWLFILLLLEPSRERLGTVERLLFDVQDCLVVEFDAAVGEAVDDRIVIGNDVEVPFVVQDTTRDIYRCGVVAGYETLAINNGTVVSDECSPFDVSTSRATHSHYGTVAVDMDAGVVGDSHGEVAEDIDTITAMNYEIRWRNCFTRWRTIGHGGGSIANEYHGVSCRTQRRSAGHGG